MLKELGFGKIAKRVLVEKRVTSETGQGSSVAWQEAFKKGPLNRARAIAKIKTPEGGRYYLGMGKAKLTQEGALQSAQFAAEKSHARAPADSIPSPMVRRLQAGKTNVPAILKQLTGRK